MRNHFLIVMAALALAPFGARAATIDAAREMPMGAAVIPPLGFTELCQRRPDQCVDTRADADLGAVRLWAGQVRWSIVFGSVDGIALEGPAAAVPGSIASLYRRSETVLSILPWADFPSEAPAPELDPATAASGLTPMARVVSDVSAKDLAKVNGKVNRSIRRARDIDVYGRADYWASPADNVRSGDCEDYVLAKRQALIDKGVPGQAMSIAIVRTPQGEMHAVLLVATAAGEVVLDNLSPWVMPWNETPYRWLERQVPGAPTQWVSVAAQVS